MNERVLLSWSGGKDSMMALYKLRQSPAYNVSGLITTVTEGYNRISMHGVRIELLERQASALGLSLNKVWLPKDASNEEYRKRMHAALIEFREAGISSVAFGDVFLEDVRRYREKLLSEIGMDARFPIWKEDTLTLARAFINAGFKAFIVCVDSKVLDQSFVGRTFDDTLAGDLPPNVDPSGENGEFHTFVYDGPLFKRPVPCRVGQVVLRESYYYCDLIPDDLS